MTKFLRSIRLIFLLPPSDGTEGYRLLNEYPRTRDITG
jgi:hypothetical protein